MPQDVVRLQWEYEAFPLWGAEVPESSLSVSLRNDLQQWNDECEVLAWGDHGPDAEQGRDREAEAVMCEALDVRGPALAARLRDEIGDQLGVEYLPVQ